VSITLSARTLDDSSARNPLVGMKRYHASNGFMSPALLDSKWPS
jgi:hypothetical protein